MTNISLNSGFLLSNYAWTNMKKNKKGVIIFVSSRSGIEGFKNESAYCASKHGLEGLMKSLAIEGEKNKWNSGFYTNTGNVYEYTNVRKKL